MLKIVEFVEVLMQMRDPYEDGHAKRVAHLSSKIADLMGIPIEEILNLEFAARLHDLGKMMIAETILNKTKLTDAERNMIKSHPVFGAKAVEVLGLDDSISLVIRYHHENWDGSGYPNGLLANEIPLGARILRVADCYDAMTNKRPYREIYSSQHALIEMAKEEGSSFDPLIFKNLKRIIGS